MGWYITLDYFLGMTATCVVLKRFDGSFSNLYADGGVVGLRFIFFCVIWPLALVGYTINGVLRIPEILHRYRKSRLNNKRQAELDIERHKTALATERADQAEAYRRELRALDLPIFGIE